MSEEIGFGEQIFFFLLIKKERKKERKWKKGLCLNSNNSVLNYICIIIIFHYIL